jgi:ribonuclease HI
MKIVAHIDGSCLGNPGESGFGVVLENESGQTLMTLGRYIGKGTNNIAEYHGLLGAVQLAHSLKAESLCVLSDSELLVRQMNGIYKIKQAHLMDLHEMINREIRKSGLFVEIKHIPRQENRIADGLARKAIRMKGDVH